MVVLLASGLGCGGLAPRGSAGASPSDSPDAGASPREEEDWCPQGDCEVPVVCVEEFCDPVPVQSLDAGSKDASAPDEPEVFEPDASRDPAGDAAPPQEHDCDGGWVLGDTRLPPHGFADPVVQCSWEHSNVLGAPLVADLNGDGQPEVIFMSQEDKRVVAIDGRDCRETWRSQDAFGAFAQLAVGDVNDDGRPEVVGLDRSDHMLVVAADGSLIARATEAVAPDLDGPNGAGYGAPAIANLDGRGPAEIVFGAMALRLEGQRLVTLYNHSVPSPDWGLSTVVADVDEDGLPEVITGNRILNGVDGSDRTPAGVRDWPAGAAAIVRWDETTPGPEVALVSTRSGSDATLRVYDPRDGSTLFGPYTLATNFSPIPMVADLNGDGREEIGYAVSGRYVVYDPRCGDPGDPLGCAATGLGWQAPIHESNGGNGGTAFDLNGDGQVELIYRDECRLRIHRGTDGTVLFEELLNHGTSFESVVLADVDADGHAEFVVPAQKLDLCAVEPGSATASGLPLRQGIFVYAAPQARWLPTRPIWNQHSYHVSNVFDDGTIPLRERPIEGFAGYRQNAGPLGMPGCPTPAP